MHLPLATTATQPSHYVDKENRRSCLSFGWREAMHQYCLQWEACCVRQGPFLPRDTRCLKCRCWGQWSVDTLMDSVVSQGTSRRLNRWNGQKFQVSQSLSCCTLLKLIQSSKATKQNLSELKANTDTWEHNAAHVISLGKSGMLHMRNNREET